MELSPLACYGVHYYGQRRSTFRRMPSDLPLPPKTTEVGGNFALREAQLRRQLSIIPVIITEVLSDTPLIAFTPLYQGQRVMTSLTKLIQFFM